MEKLLEIACNTAEEVEIFYYQNEISSMSVRNNELREINTKMQSGYALRIIKDGKIGTAYTKNLLDRHDLVKDALASFEGNIAVDYSFPEPEPIRTINQFDDRIESLTYSNLYDRTTEVLDFFKGETKGQIDCISGFSRGKHRILNSKGLDYTSRNTNFYIVPSILFPNTQCAVRKIFMFHGPENIPEEQLKKQLDVYNSTLQEVRISTGRMKVLFMPLSMITLMWRISEGISGKFFYEKTSPVYEKIGERIFSEKITIYNDPLDTDYVGAIAFDDEGVPTKRLNLYENGVLRNCYVNLDYSAKLNLTPTGTGMRNSMWGGDPVSLQPVSWLDHPRIAPGDMSFEQLVGSMEKGIIVHSMLGAHSGNILNGDFSVGLNPGFYVENGEITGRVKDGMIAGNIYDLFRNVAGIENRVHNPHCVNVYPCVLFDDVNVSAK